MLADKGLAPARKRERRLQMAAAGEHAGAVGAEVDRLGNEAARAAQKGRRAVDDLHHAVVGAHDDVAVMGHDQIGDARQLVARFVVVGDQRLAAGIGAGRDQREIAAPRLARRPPRETADDAPAHRPASRRAAPCPARRRPGRLLRLSTSTIGCAGERSRASSSARRLREKRHGCLVGDHDRERLGLAIFARAAAARRFPRCARRRADESRRCPSAPRFFPRARRRRFRRGGCDRRGPHCGQAIGSAWKRRLAGSA